MPRSRRIKVKGESSFYHIISRTVGQEFYLGDIEKENLVNIIKYYSGYYFVKVLGFCVMSNHFHLLIKSEPEGYYDDAEVYERVKRYKKRDRESLSAYGLQSYRAKMEDISEYVRSVKQTFSVWYNRQNNRSGYFWGDRFKSVLIEDGETLLTCLAYIELNPLRAGLVKLPEEYRWSSFSYRLARGYRDNFLSFDGFFEKEEKSKREILSDYRYFVYKAGNIKSVSLADIEAGRELSEKPRISDEIYDYELKRQFTLPKSELLLKRIRYFSDGLVIGSKGFIKEAYNRFGGEIIQKKDRKVYKTGLSKSILSIRKLKVPF